ncbi:MAG: hypothetical protein WCV85_05350 [Patescibacteria group bacterium]|jgi:NTP pyrophosphatase (non-canonical NTP hydrolase)
MQKLSLQELTALILEQAKQKGFGTQPDEVHVAEKIALIHAEVSEAYEAYRHKKLDGPHGFAEELGDVIQRVLHLAGVFNIDMEKAILQKLQNNKDREWKWDEMHEGHA